MKAEVIKLFPQPFIKFFAKPYIGGESDQKVINLAKQVFIKNKFLATLDALGEDVHSEDDINTYLNIYLELIKKVSTMNLFDNKYEQPSVSLKPSCFTLAVKNADGSLDTDKMDLKSCYENIYKICSFAKEKGVMTTVDMEDRHWTDFTLETYFKLLDAGLDNVGTVIQTRLNRTKEDINLFNEKSRVRLVIGIYNEPSDVAITDKNLMKSAMVEFAGTLLDKGAFVEFATHDTACIKRFITEIIIPRKIQNDRYEIQMLLGVPRSKLQKDFVSGEYLKGLLGENSSSFKDTKINLRLYLPFAQTWDNAVAYLRRRLTENPNIVAYGIKHLFTY